MHFLSHNICYTKISLFIGSVSYIETMDKIRLLSLGGCEAWVPKKGMGCQLYEEACHARASLCFWHKIPGEKFCPEAGAVSSNGRAI